MANLVSSMGYFMPTRISYGLGKLDTIGEEVRPLGRKALLVTGRSSARKHGYLERALSSLDDSGVSVTVFDGVATNPSNETVDRGAQLALEQECDVIIGLGGGSALDVAKAISVVVTVGTDIWTLVEAGQVDRDVLPIVAVPTTAGTGSEATLYAVISNRALRRKDALGSPRIYPTLAILDPELTLSLDRFHTASSGMDVVTHAIEAYTSALSNEFSDILAIEAIRLAARNLRTAVWDGGNIPARSGMMIASTLAGMALSQADTTIAHTIGEAVGAIYNTDHGTSVTLTLPAVMEYNCVADIEKYAHITELMGECAGGSSMRERALRSAQVVRDLIEDVGLPLGLGALGVSDISEVMPLVTRPGMADSNPRAIDNEGLERILVGSIPPAMSYWELE